MALKFDVMAVLSTAEPQDVYQAYLDEKNPSDMEEEIIIDLENLQNYIAQTEQIIPFKTGDYKKTLQNNLVEAKIIEALAIGYNQSHQYENISKVYWKLPQTYRQEGNARRYYTGSIALQRCHKMIREICLGYGVELDINTSVFAFYKTIIEDMMDGRAPVITQYMTNKKSFRDSIGDVLKNTFPHKRERAVKQCITALGFGATDAQFGAIDQILRNEEDLQAFNAHPYIVELKEVIKTVHVFLKEAGKERIESLRGKEGWMRGRAFNYKKFYAHVYQEWETDIMKELARFVESSGAEVMLWVHDGIYIRGKLDAGYQAHIQSLFGQHISFERKDIRHFAYTNPGATNDEEIHHKARMLREDYKAKGYDVTEITWDEWLAEARSIVSGSSKPIKQWNKNNQSHFDGSTDTPDTWGLH